jgi:TAG lipase/steryl ester hydrolase/phospholipase A2/LPA acyltransferase
MLTYADVCWQGGEMIAYHLTDVKWKDGSLHADLPITRISELFNVNHFIVSQTNPHAIPFMSKPLRTRKKEEHMESKSPGVMRRGWSVMRYLITSELAHRFRQAVTMGLVPKILEATLFQRLSGDITIVPPFKLTMYTNIISNPTWDTIKMFMEDALRCTWPNISIIRSHCEVELMLDISARSLAKHYQGQFRLLELVLKYLVLKYHTHTHTQVRSRFVSSSSY